MDAGRELDALIADRIFGYKPLTTERGVSVLMEWDDCPHYSTDIAAAALVLERLYQVRIEHTRDSGWRVGFWVNPYAGMRSAEAATLPHAICLAALKWDW